MEGGLRVPFIIRWPGKVPAGRVSNEIVHQVDIFPTLAKIAGATIPNDRAFDGIDVGDFLLGKREQSGREGFVIFVADDLRAVKWRNWKMHYAWAERKIDPVLRYSTVPKVVDLIRDPREERGVAEPYNVWLQFRIIPLIVEFQTSVQRYPNVPMGAPDNYTPPKK